jgi:hypothetical protein
MRAGVVIGAVIVAFAPVSLARAEGPTSEAIARLDRPAAHKPVTPAAQMAPVMDARKPDVPAEERVIPNRLEPVDVQRSVGQHRVELDQCVRAYHALPDAPPGELNMVWTILPDGDTVDISAENADPDNMSLAHCLRDLIDNWYFPQHQLAQRVQFKFRY